MIRQEDIISLWLAPREIKYCVAYAKQLVDTFTPEIEKGTGGKSHIRDVEDRKQNLGIDQIVGQLGEYTLSLYLFGTAERYYIQRLSAGINPTLGDLGQDILGLNVDCKSSLMRGSENPLEYHLIVRPKERHDNWCYFKALVKPNGERSILTTQPILVYLVGWARDSQLPAQTDSSGPLAGAYTIKAYDLNPLPNMFWAWRSYNSETWLNG